MSLQDIGIECKRDEEILSQEDVKQIFDKTEFMNKFYTGLMQAMHEGIT